MSDKVQIIIEGKADGVKMAFAEIVTGSEKVSAAMQESGAKGAEAMRYIAEGATHADQALVSSTSRMEEFRAEATKIGTAIGTLIGVSSLLGQSYTSQEQQIAALDRSYGSASEQMQRFAEMVQQTTTASNDQAREAELIAATLARNYGFTASEVQKVITVSADLAAVTGYSLTDATERVTAALRGEAESAEMLGLTMNQAAIDREGLTLTMSNEEAAHFRLNALLGQAAFAEGAAADKAASHAGQARQLVNELQDVGQSVGGALGPLGQYTAVLGNVALIAPAAGAGIGKLASGITAAGSLAAVMGPAGLAAAALAAGAGIAYLATQTDDYVDAADRATIASQDLSNFFASLAASLDPDRAKLVNDLYGSLIETITDAAARESDLQGILDLSKYGLDRVQLDGIENAIDLTVEGAYRGIEAVSGLTAEQVNYLDTNKDLVLSIDEVNTALASFQGNLDRLNGDQIGAVEEDIKKLLTLPNVNLPLVVTTLNTWIERLNDGTISSEEFVRLLDEAASSYRGYLNSSNAATSGTQAFTAAQRSLNDVLLANNEAMFGSVSATDSLAETQRRTAAQAQALQRQDSVAYYTMNQQTKQIAEMRLQTAVNTELSLTELGRQSAAAASTREAYAEWAGGMETSFYVAITGVNRWSAEQNAAFAEAAQAAQAADALVSGMLESEAQKATAASQALASYAAALGRVPHMESNSAYGFAARATEAGSALGDAFRVAVGNTNQIGSQSQQVADWAKQLINVKDQTGQIDDLLARGVITQGEYNAAQDAGTRIFAANAAIQDDILKIQTDQAPILAQLTEEQQRYMDHLADLPADQQMVRLAYMDTNESLKAQQALALAAAAANGELGAAGEASAQSLIAGAAAADPYLKALLLDMGVISVGADGTITVNFDDVTSANTDMDTLIGKLNELIELIAESLNIDISSNALEEAANLQSLDTWLNNLNGKRSTVYIDTVGNLGPTGGGQEVALHGGVMGYRGGGVVARMAEGNNPELLRFRGGGTALALTDGLYNVPQGTYVTPAPATKQLVGGGHTTIIIENVWANDPEQFADGMRARGFVGARG